jgi:hypothetical protein
MVGNVPTMSHSMLRPIIFVLALLASSAVSAQGVTEPPVTMPPAPGFGERFGPPGAQGELTPPQPPVSREAVPPSTQRLEAGEIQRDLARLPTPVRVLRDRLVQAARGGDITVLATIIRENPVRVRVDADTVDDAAALWRMQYPDSEGREVLGLLLNLLDQPYVRVDAETPNEMYVWPAYAHLALNQLTPAQQVEVYRLVTGADLQQMTDAAAWTFFRLGIGADGTLHYFFAGE